MNEAKWSGIRWSEVTYREGEGGRVFMEEVYRSSKWWEVKDWGELMIGGGEGGQLQETVHGTLLLVCFYLLYMYLSHVYFC